jgi:anaerobic selenocysteine-containing dehydrogenase
MDRGKSSIEFHFICFRHTCTHRRCGVARRTKSDEAISTCNYEIASGCRPRNDDYPLQAIGHHTLHRVHSTHDNNDWLEEAFPQRVFINPLDAGGRGIKDGDEVKVFNERGALILPCRITPRILPGVVDIPQGAWYEPDKNGIDRGGCVNVLTSHHWTPFAYGTAQHTIMVEVEKAEE